MAEGAQTVDKAITVLEAVARSANAGCSLRSLCEETGIQKTTVLRLLSSLRAHGYVAKDATGRYRLGSAAVALGVAARLNLQHVARPHLEALVKATGETALLHVVHSQESLCVDKVDSPKSIRVFYDVGRRGPLYAGSSGKTLLAFMPTADREEILSHTRLVKYGPHTIVDPTQLRTELDKIRQQGYAPSEGELDEGVRSVGAPIWNAVGTLEGGIGLIAPAERWMDETAQNHIDAVVTAASAISYDLGHRSEVRRVPRPVS